MAPVYPAEVVWEAGKSFYETVDRMTSSPDLLDAPARTRFAANAIFAVRAR